MEGQYGIVEPENPKGLHSLQDIAEAQPLAGLKIELPSPPSIVARILKAVQDDDNCFAELGRIISNDPALVAKLL